MIFFKQNIYTKKLLTLAFPIIASSALQMAYNFTDMIWVGRLGSLAVTSVGTAGLISYLAWALASIVSVGTSVRISQSRGAKDEEAIKRYKAAAIYGILGLAVLCGLSMFFCADLFISFFRLNNGFAVSNAISYVKVEAISLPFNFIILFATSLFNAYGFTKLSLKVSIIGALANIFLDPLFIFVFNLGVVGAAYSSLISRIIMVIIASFICFRNNDLKIKSMRLEWNSLKDLFKIGLPISVQRIMFSLVSIVIARLVAEWGDVAIAVQKIGVQLEAFTYMIVGGLMQATTILTGHSYGAKKYNRIKIVYFSGLKIAITIGTLSTILFLTFPETLYHIFVSEKSTLTMGSHYLHILAFSQIFMCIEMITGGLFHGLGKTKIPSSISIIFTTLRVPMAYFLSLSTILDLGLNGVWWSISISSIMKGLVAFSIAIYLFKYKYTQPSYNE